VRTCSKSTCNEPAGVTLVLRYERRQVALLDLLPEFDPNHLEMCQAHADRLVPPIGWVVEDERTASRPAAPLGELGFEESLQS
jgi:hypothetical protein